MRAFRALSQVLLVLILISNSVTMAVARHQPRAIGEMVLCTGTGVISVSIDENGNPTGPMVPCPDCTPALAALPDLPEPGFDAEQRLVPFEFIASSVRAIPQHPRVHRRSRAPPVSV